MKWTDFRKVEGRRHQVPLSGTGHTMITPIITAAAPRRADPQAFLAEFMPDGISAPHFHMEHQFQLVVAGGGTIGRKPLRPVSLHYAERKTGYGPITASGEGLGYLTLRPRSAFGAMVLPESRSLQRPGELRRQLTVDLGPCTDALQDEAQPQHREVIATTDDGLGAYARWLPANALDQVDGLVDEPVLRGVTQDRYVVVLTGSVTIEGDELVPWSCVFAAAGERLPAMRAGAGGAQLLHLQFPASPDDDAPLQ